MSEFVDFHVLTGSSRVAKVRALKARGEYEPATDFWRPLRNAIAAFYQSPEGDKRSLAEFLVPISDRKVGRYQAAMAGHARFARRKEIHGFRAPSATWEVGALRVRINPEIGLHIDGRRFISKLYFKAEPLSRGRAQALIALMEEELRSQVVESMSFAVLDIPNATLRVADARSPLGDTQIALRAEAQSFIEIWNLV